MKYYALVLHKRVGVGIVSPEIFCFFMTHNGMGWDSVTGNILFFYDTKWNGLGLCHQKYFVFLCHKKMERIFISRLLFVALRNRNL